MRKIMLMMISAVFMSSILSGALAAVELKMGVLDFQKVITESKVAKKMNDDLQEKYMPRQEEIRSLQNKIQTKAKKSDEKSSELQRNESVMKAPQIRKLREEIEQLSSEIIALRRDLERKGEYFQSDLQKDQAAASKKFSDEVEAEVNRIGKSENFDVIFQKQATVYVKKSKHDITDKVISGIDKKLGKKS